MKTKIMYAIGSGVWGCMALLAILAFRHEGPAQRPVSTEVETPNILKSGDIPSALRQSRQLFLALKEVGWNRWKVPLKLQHFADQQYAEDPGVRDAKLVRVAVPDPDSKAYKEIAFFLDIYVRKNIQHLSDFDAIAHPEGFYIVCYKNGDIQQIPVEDVRLMPKSAHSQYRECFPGQALYKKSLPQLEYVALASKQKP